MPRPQPTEWQKGCGLYVIYAKLNPRHDQRVPERPVPRRVVFLAVPDLQILDLASPLEVFNGAHRAAEAPGKAGYEIDVVSADPGRLPTSGGLDIYAGALPDPRCRIDTVILPGGDGARATPPDSPAISWIRAVAPQTRRIATVCTGAFLAGRAGLLVQRRVATHWLRTDLLQAKFPTAKVDPDRLYVQDGNLWSSGGVTAGIDLALAMVEQDHNAEIAQIVARHLVLSWWRRASTTAGRPHAVGNRRHDRHRDRRPLRIWHRRNHATHVRPTAWHSPGRLPGPISPQTQFVEGEFAMRVAILLFDRMTALDAVGPYELLQRVPDFDITFVGREKGEIRTENGMLGLTVDARLEDVPNPEVVLVPGGVGSRQLLTDDRVLDWLREAHRTSRLTTSVCSGSLVLAAAGLLAGKRAATHWGVYDLLEQLGAVASRDRVVPLWDDRIVTSAGVSSGIDMALAVIAHLVDDVAAMAAQLQTEYDPQPPFDAGSVEKAGPLVMARVREYGAVRA